MLIKNIAKAGLDYGEKKRYKAYILWSEWIEAANEMLLTSLFFLGLINYWGREGIYMLGL